jgi:hypothetical protein
MVVSWWFHRKNLGNPRKIPENCRKTLENLGKTRKTKEIQGKT